MPQSVKEMIKDLCDHATNTPPILAEIHETHVVLLAALELLLAQLTRPMPGALPHDLSIARNAISRAKGHQ